MPNFANTWVKGGKMMLDLELTQKMIEVQLIKEKTGTYPTTLPMLKSQVCPEQTWQYQVKNNQVTFNFSQELPWMSEEQAKENNVVLPLTFTLK
jgi:hypothetical protein